MIIDNEKRYVFVAVPKTGSISIQLSLGHEEIPEPDQYHQRLSTALAADPNLGAYFKFGFVRNPWDRMLSLYRDFTCKRIDQYSGLVKVEQPLFSEFSDFTDFCVRVHDSEWLNDIFFTSQVELLGVTSSLADFIGRFENLHADFKKVCDIIGVEAELRHENKGIYQSGLTYRDYYIPESRQAIFDLYKDDAELFGYRF